MCGWSWRCSMTGVGVVVAGDVSPAIAVMPALDQPSRAEPTPTASSARRVERMAPPHRTWFNVVLGDAERRLGHRAGRSDRAAGEAQPGERAGQQDEQRAAGELRADVLLAALGRQPGAELLVDRAHLAGVADRERLAAGD